MGFSLEVMKISRRKIEAYANQIAARFKVQKIILFGSHATGLAKGDSDVDLLVVMNHPAQAARQAATIRQCVPFDGALDLVVRSPAEVRKRLRWNDDFLKEIMEHGIPLYGSNH